MGSGAVRGEGDRDDLRARVAAAVNLHDPEGVLSAGAPDDEYGPEIDELVDLVRSGEVTEAGVRDRWERWFGPGSAVTRSTTVLTELTASLRGLLP